MPELRKPRDRSNADAGATHRAGWSRAGRIEARLIARILVIGYGNPLRGDDGLGWLVARRLAEEVAGGGIVVLALHQLTPELAEEISMSGLVIFVDADCEQEPGRLSCKIIAPYSYLPGATTHHLDPPSLLAFTQALYGTLPKTAILLTVGGKSFSYEEGLSPIVTATVPILEQILEAFINKTKEDVL